MAATEPGPVIGIDALPYYIKRIVTFLESDKKTLSCPKISQQLQDVLVKISMEGTEFLNSDVYTSDVNIEAARLAAAIKTNANVKLAHEISDGKHGSNVLMYKKMQVTTFKVPEPLRVPFESVVKQASNMEPPSDGFMTQIFKTNCLNAATKFVKDDSQMVLRFPEMFAAQAEFVMAMIQPGIEGKSEKTDIGFGFRSMYAPLWESMRVFSLKYEYKIGYGTKPVSKDGMKQLVFEKISKCNTIETVDLTSEDTPEAIIDTDLEEFFDDSSSTSSSSIVTSKSNKGSVLKKKMSKRKIPGDNKPNIKRKIEKLIRKLSLRMQKGLITKKLVHDALRRISDFLLDDQQKSIVFEETTQHHQFFLSNVKRLSTETATYMLFDTACQKFLDNIKYCLNKRKVQYSVTFMKGTVKTIDRSNKKATSLKSLVFKKVLPKALEPIKAEPEPLSSSLSSKSATSLIAAESQKLKQSQQQHIVAKKGKKGKVAAQVEEKLSKGFLNEEFIETTLQSISDFMLDERQASIVFRPAGFHHLHFIQKVSYIARNEETYRVFSYESQKLLASINRCFKSNVLYQVRQFKGRKNVILEKMANFDSNNEKSSSLSLASTSSVISISTDDSAASLKQSKQTSQTKTNKQAEKAMNEMKKKMRFEILSNEFIETTLQRICDFMYNDQRNILFQDVSGDHYRFIKYVECIARDQNWHCLFRSPSQKLLADLNRCFEKHMLYSIKQIKMPGWKDLILEKLGPLPTKKLIKEIENNENVNKSNIPSAPIHPTTPLSQLDQDLLIRLKVIKETVARTSGERAITDFLQDLSSFLSLSNTDRMLTFYDVSENEAIFLKHVHALSKMEAGYAMFSRDSQKLLKSIRMNAQTHKLNFKMIVDDNNQDLWTVIIKKQWIIPANEKKKVHRARSLSAGRRAQQSASNAKIDMTPRGASTQRFGVLEKLKAGLAQPVQSDKALRMMASMGWTGGALGIRGEGITEPIALPLDIATRAGFGHVPSPKKPKAKPKKFKPLKQGAPQSFTQLPQASKQETPKSCTPSSFQPVSSLPSDVIPPGILPTGSVEKVSKTVVLTSNYHVPILRSILEMVTTDIDVIHFTCEKNQHRPCGFLKHAVAAFNGRYRFDLDNEVQRQLVAEISHTFDCSRATKLNVEIIKNDLLLEKLTINNNDSVTNQNAPVAVKKAKVKKAKSLVSVRLQNAVADNNITLKKENESVNNIQTINNSVPNNKVSPNINNSAPNVNNVAPITKSAPTTSALSDTDLICKNTNYTKKVDDNTALSNNGKDVTQTDTNCATYIIPVESKMFVESCPKDNITETIQNDKIQNNSNLNGNSNKHTSNTNSVSKNYLYYKDCECLTVFEEARSNIMINSNDKEVTFCLENKINSPSNNLTEEKEKDTVKLTKEKGTSKKSINEKDTSRKVIKAKVTSKTLSQENVTNEIKNGSDDYYDSEDTILEKEDRQPALIQERKRPLFGYPKSLPKKYKLLTDFKKIYILPKNYPQTKIDGEKAREIQSAILLSIDYTQESLPFLKCQGIQNGGLIYSCQDEKSLFFLENLIQNMDDLKIVYEFDVEEQLSHKMAFRINSYIAEPVINVLNRFELYNTGLNPTQWGVVKMEQYSDFAVIYVEVDDHSFNYICEVNFILYAGNDCARFTMVWD